MSTTPRDARWMGAPFPAASVDDALRTALARLDPKTTTPEQVHAAFATGGFYVTSDWAAEWLDAVRRK